MTKSYILLTCGLILIAVSAYATKGIDLENTLGKFFEKEQPVKQEVTEHHKAITGIIFSIDDVVIESDTNPQIFMVDTRLDVKLTIIVPQEYIDKGFVEILVVE